MAEDESHEQVHAESPDKVKEGEKKSFFERLTAAFQHATQAVIALGALLVAVVTVSAYAYAHLHHQHKLTITVSCALSQISLRPGMTVQLTYHIHASSATTVGLGAGLYDSQGNDHSTGTGDIDSIAIPAGASIESRPVPIPAGLPPSTYELDAEIWPPNEIGDTGVNDYADATCTLFAVAKQ